MIQHWPAEVVSFWPQVHYEDIFEGILYSINLSITTVATQPNEGFATIGITDGSPQAADAVATLISGPFGTNVPLAWEGRFPIFTDARIMVTSWTPQNATINLGWLQVMPSADLSSKQVLDA